MNHVLLELQDKNKRVLRLRWRDEEVSLDTGETYSVLSMETRRQLCDQLRSRDPYYDHGLWWNDRHDQMLYRPSAGLLVFAMMRQNAMSITAFEFSPEHISELVAGLTNLPKTVRERDRMQKLSVLLSERDALQKAIDQVRSEMAHDS